MIDADIEEMVEDDWQTWARDHPHSTVPTFSFADLGKRPLDIGWDINATRGCWNEIEKMARYLDELKRDDAVADNAPDPVDLDSLTPEQCVIFEGYVETYHCILRGDDVHPRLLNIDGTAGCGKTFLIKAICQELHHLTEQLGHSDPIRVIAPSSVAALNIFGRTIHSALGLPINRDFVPLSGSRLAAFQVLWKGVHFVIIDEKSMVGLHMLALVDLWLRQMKPWQGKGNCLFCW
jgi:hypothetical protein